MQSIFMFVPKGDVQIAEGWKLCKTDKMDHNIFVLELMLLDTHQKKKNLSVLLFFFVNEIILKPFQFMHK